MNKLFTAYEAATGRILYSGTAHDPEALATEAIGILPDAKHEGGWLTGSTHHPMPENPSPHHTFNWVTKTWHDPRTLQDLKDAKWTTIKQARDAAMAAPLITPYGVFDADPAASANIIKSVLLANNLTSLGYPVEIKFTLYDDSVVVLDGPAMVQVGLILAAREQEIRDQATLQRDQL